MQKNGLISVILPIYNVEKYLPECLDSLLNQTYTNFQLIAVNDGSTDTSLKILKKYANKFKNIEIIDQQNGGLSNARNSGLPYIKGEYTYFLDSDDYLLENAFENLIKKASKHSLDLVKFDALSFSDEDIDYPFTDYDSSNFLNKEYIYSKNHYLKAIKNKFMPPVWLYFIKSSIIKDNKLSFVEGLLHEDEVFTTQLLNYCNRIMYDPHKYFQRRYRSESIMTSKRTSNDKSTKSKVQIISLFDKMLQCEADNKIYEDFVKERQNDMFTLLLFEKNDEFCRFLPLKKSYQLKISYKTAARQIKKNFMELFRK